MTLVILPGRAAMIEYDGFYSSYYLSIMIIFEPCDHKTSNPITRSHTTFDLPPTWLAEFTAPPPAPG